jgi:hypothetical protein
MRPLTDPQAALLKELVAERFGPLFEVAREAPPTAAEVLRRRRVLLGIPMSDTPAQVAARRAILLDEPSTDSDAFLTKPVDSKGFVGQRTHAGPTRGEED